MPLAGSRLFQAGDVLTAEQVQSFLMDQSIMGFEDTSARDAAFGGIGEATLARGMFAYTADTNTLWLYDSINWVPAINAASLNGVGQSVAFTPTFANFTLGNGTVNYATFVRVQNLVFVQLKVTLGSTSAVTGNIFFGCPVVPVEQNQGVVGNCQFNDAGVATFAGQVSMATSGGNGQLQLFPQNAAGTYLSTATTSATVPFTWTTTDSFVVSATYRVA
jgi:hypothetical protein